MNRQENILKAARLKARYECLQVANKISSVLACSDQLPLHVGLKTDAASDVTITPPHPTGELQTLTGIGPNAIAGLVGLPLIRAALINIQTALICESESDQVTGSVTFRNRGLDVPYAMKEALSFLKCLSVDEKIVGCPPQVIMVIDRLEKALELFETEKKSSG